MNPTQPLRPRPDQHADARHMQAEADSRFIHCEQQPDPVVVEALGKVAQVSAEYPPALLAARRAEFVAKLRAYTDPDTVAGPSDVSEWQDDRNSRPFPW